MKRHTLYALPILVLALAACSTSKPIAASASSTATTVAAATHAASSGAAVAPAASPSASATPLSFYANQYLAIVKPGNDAFAVFNALPSSATDAEVGAAAAKVVPVEQSAEAALLRAQWPPNVAADIKALVTSYGPLFGDLSDLTASNVDQMNRDAGAANAAANIVRADLGLPPIS
jgi:hypothetical protein